MSNEERYHELSNALKYKFKGVELSHVVSLKIWGVARGKNAYSWRHLANLFRKYDVRSLELPKYNGFLSTFMEEWRKDHYCLYNTVINRMAITPTQNDLFKLNKRISFHPFILGELACRLSKNLRNTGLSFIQKVCWFSEYALLCNTVQDLEEMDFSKVTKYLSMCHILGLENLLTQYLRQKGIATYSLEEGIYMVYKKSFVIGAIAYENFATDHLLCWGQFTKDQYIEYGIDADRIDVAGYPKGNVLKQQKQNNQYRKCLVMLAGPVFGDVNSNLLSMLEVLRDEVDITLKSHPVNYTNMEQYAINHALSIVPRTRTITDCFENDNYDFCIAVNTTAYYESWMFGIPCIRYYDERFDNFHGFDDFFSSKDELNFLLNQYKIKAKSEQEVREMLEYAIGFGLDNYDKIVNG